MHHFDEPHPAFKGFSKYFEEEVSPFQTTVKGYLWPYGTFGFVMSAIFLLGGFASLLLFVFQLPIVISVVFNAALLGFTFLIYDVNKYPDEIAADYVSIMKIASFAGLSFSSETKASLLLWRSLGLIPTTNIQNETIFNLEGTYKGVQIKLTHEKLYTTDESADFLHPSRVLSFDGHLIRLDIPKPFSGITVVTRDLGKGQPKTHNTLKRVGLVDPVFERIFEVYGSDQVESRALLSPDLMQEIVDLERITRGKSIEFGFIAGQLFIKLNKPMLDTREALESGDYNAFAAQNLINEIGCVFDIIDAIARFQGFALI